MIGSHSCAGQRRPFFRHRRPRGLSIWCRVRETHHSTLRLVRCTHPTSCARVAGFRPNRQAACAGGAMIGSYSRAGQRRPFFRHRRPRGLSIWCRVRETHHSTLRLVRCTHPTSCARVAGFRPNRQAAYAGGAMIGSYRHASQRRPFFPPPPAPRPVDLV